MKKFVVALVVVFVIIILGLGYYGLIPGVSTIMGANKPRDLGASWTEADLNSIHQKNGVQDLTLPAGNPPENSLKFEGSRQLQNSFTPAELTARAVEGEKYKYNPLSNQQIRINPDGTAEVSGNIDLNKIEDARIAIGLQGEDMEVLNEVVSKFKLVNSNPAYYAKAKLAIKDNRIDMQIEEAEIGRLPIPIENAPLGLITGLASGQKPSFTKIPMDKANSLFERVLARISGLSIKSLTIRDGQMYFDGTVPQKIYKVLE